MSVTPGRFSKLPHLALRGIASLMDLTDLLTLSLMSPKFNYAVGFLNYPVLKLKWIISAPGHFVIRIIQQNQPDIILKFVLQVCSLKFVSSGVLVDGLKIEISRIGQSFVLRCGSSDLEKPRVFEAFTEFLLKICKPETFDFCSNLYIGSIFDHTRKFETFKLSHQKLDIECAKLIFEGIEADIFKLEGIQIYTQDFQVFQLKHREMDLGDAPWLSSESFKNITCEILKYNQNKLKAHHIQSSDIVHVAKSWLSGEFENLKKIEIYLPRIYQPREELYKIRVEVDSELRKLGGVEVGEQMILTQDGGKQARTNVISSMWTFSVL